MALLLHSNRHAQPNSTNISTYISIYLTAKAELLMELFPYNVGVFFNKLFHAIFHYITFIYFVTLY